MPGIPAGIQYRPSISYSPQGAQLRDGFSPAGVQQGRKGQLEAAGEPGKEEGGPSLQSSKAFPNQATFERNGRSGEAGHSRGIIRGKATLGFTRLSGLLNRMMRHRHAHMSSCTSPTPGPHTPARILLILNFDCFLLIQSVAPAKPSSNSPCSPGWPCISVF